jgi:threonine synthase
MQLYSTNSPDTYVDLKKAVIQGLPEDNGLYMPDEIPALPASFFQKLPSLSFPEMAFELVHHLLNGAVPEDDLREIVEGAINFEAPVVPVSEQIGMLELFHGPTLAFKDFGARFMARLMSYFVQGESRELNILVATSGDTGGAVASGFYKTPGTRVIILYPSGKVSFLQEKQLTTLGHNITAIEVEGTFDDCQALVKQAFLDSEVRGHLYLTSANSINISRLIPQMLYYFRAYQQLMGKKEKIVFCVPSGNFGNLTAGLMARKMGLPVHHFVAATNINRVVPSYLESGLYEPRPSLATISNAMDVGKPSNFARMLDLYDHAWEDMKGEISGFHYTDAQTRQAIQRVKKEYDYLLDPHGAVGFLAMEAYQQSHPDTYGVVLATAHPSKFLDVVEPVIGEKVPVPERLAVLADRPKEALQMGTDFEQFKSYLLRLDA